MFSPHRRPAHRFVGAHLNQVNKHTRRALAVLLVATATTVASAGAPYEHYRFSTYAGGAGNGAGSSDGAAGDARFRFPYGLAIDGADNIYVADAGNHTIRKISATGVVTTVAGSAGAPASTDGSGSAARFNDPEGVAIDSTGNLYVADTGNRTIRKITAAGLVTTFAGLAGTAGSADGLGGNARFQSPRGIACDAGGNVYVADAGNYTIRKITPDGLVSTLAGFARDSGWHDANGTAARFVFPQAVTLDNAGNIYVADGNAIRQINPAGDVRTLAGNALLSVQSTFRLPGGVAVDSSGTVYVAETGSHTIRKLISNGGAATIAGAAQQAGRVDGMGGVARFNVPTGLVINSSGNLIVADASNNSIRSVTQGGAVTTYAGIATPGTSGDGSVEIARFLAPASIAVDNEGNAYVADTGNSTIRKITPDLVVNTLAGSAGNVGNSDGIGAAASFNRPEGVAVDDGGNVYVADTGNNRIRKITPDGAVTTLPGSFLAPLSVAVDTARNVYVADGGVPFGGCAIRKISPTGAVTTLAGSGVGNADGAGDAAQFRFWLENSRNSYVHGAGLAVAGDGNLYVADTYNSSIRRVTPAGVVTTVVSPSFGGRLNLPRGVAVDRHGNIYVGDTASAVIRKFTPGGNETILAGAEGLLGNTDGTGAMARFRSPGGVAVDHSGYIYVADTGNNSIRIGGPASVPQSLNLSTRASVGTGENVLIGGFIASGPSLKRLLLRAIGPSLQSSGVQGVLADPTLELRDAAGNLVDSNDDWKATNQAAIEMTGIAPAHDRESAILINIAPARAYTAIVRGAGDATGIALVEVYDLTPANGSVLANLSTRASVASGERVMIGGFILGPDSPVNSNVLLRAIGPSLPIPQALANPSLAVYTGNGDKIASNDDWKTDDRSGDSQEATIRATGLRPQNDLESAILTALPHGNYTAIVSSANGSTGVALVEVYNLQ